ncbi:hypothetical protein CEXT_456431 [Caerostris extrusa]|uniref:Uncharacterized protein n=1 Tax=Caerostris extrusa TaxID=172846 RepID=A0AAV4UYV2_CAEEX|nr:hypothetical protein CEXT_456431 [Caerostris extrusa]
MSPIDELRVEVSLDNQSRLILSEHSIFHFEFRKTEEKCKAPTECNKRQRKLHTLNPDRVVPLQLIVSGEPIFPTAVEWGKRGCHLSPFWLLTPNSFGVPFSFFQFERGPERVRPAQKAQLCGWLLSPTFFVRMKAGLTIQRAYSPGTINGRTIGGAPSIVWDR